MEKVVADSSVDEGDSLDVERGASETSEYIEYDEQAALELVINTTLLVFKDYFGESFQKSGEKLFKGMF